MKSKITLRILHFLLGLAVLVVCFCVVMTVKTGGAQVDENQTEQDFDSLLTGSGQHREIAMKIGGVPVILYFTDTYEEKPLLIVQHGMTSKKEDMKDLAVNLAGLGYVVVTPDAAGHGELKNSDKLSLADLIKQTSMNFGTVISYFANSKYVENEKTSIMGFSLGGLAAFYYTANGEYQPKVVVTLCATPDFKDLAESPVACEFYQNGKEKKVKDEAERQELVESIQSISPYEKLLQNEETSFYVLCGDADETVPHDGNIRFYEDMKDTAKDIVLSVKENQKHEVKEEDYIPILEYLKGHL